MIVFALAGDSTITSASLPRRARAGRSPATSAAGSALAVALVLRAGAAAAGFFASGFAASGFAATGFAAAGFAATGFAAAGFATFGKALAVTAGLAALLDDLTSFAVSTGAAAALVFFLVGTRDLSRCKDAASPLQDPPPELGL